LIVLPIPFQYFLFLDEVILGLLLTWIICLGVIPVSHVHHFNVHSVCINTSEVYSPHCYLIPGHLHHPLHPPKKLHVYKQSLPISFLPMFVTMNLLLPRSLDLTVRDILCQLNTNKYNV
jgi:hypothetical protein